MAACAIGVLTLGHFAHIAYFELSEINLLTMEERLIALTNGSAGIEHQERAEYADRLAVLQQELRQIQDGFYAVLALLSLAVAIVITGVLLALVNPILLLLPLVAFPPLYTGRRAQAIMDRARDETAADTRLALHLFRLATGAGPGQGAARLPAPERDPAPPRASCGSGRLGASGGPSSRRWCCGPPGSSSSRPATSPAS